MISRFTNLFKKSDLDEQRAFQKRVFDIIVAEYPEKKFTLTDEPLTIESDGQVLGLTNLRSKALLGSGSATELPELTVDHFGPVFRSTEGIDREELSWTIVRTQLMPQLMPEQFLERLPLVSRDFGDNVRLAYVVDTEEAYSYVSQKDIERWGVDEDEVNDTAMSNLDERSRGIEINAFEDENSFVIVTAMDGFDAVRCVLPRLQTIVSDVVGLPFYFGVPNRDFLICWSREGDAEFQTQMRSQLSADFDQQPYPLSRHAFEVVAEGKIRLAVVSPVDKRIETSGNN